jgi:lysophospholipase L1-like esterase
LIKEKNIPENIKYLETLIEKLQSKNVRPVLVTTPVYHTYSDNIDKKNYDLMQKNVNDLVKKYNIKYFNYFTDNRFIDKDFITSDHLNEMGAEKFSKILDKDILH